LGFGVYNIHMDIKEKLINKIKELQQEAQSLVDERMALDKRHRGIDIRLTQVTGALSEMEQLLQESADETTGTE
jgi:hypothetical protein